MIKKSIKLPKDKQLAFCVDSKMEMKLKKLMKKLKLDSISETVRTCIDNYKG